MEGSTQTTTLEQLTNAASYDVYIVSCSGGETSEKSKDVTFIYDTAHSYDDGTVTKQATCLEPGEMTYTCLICGHTYTEEIPIGGHTAGEDAEITTAPSCTEPGEMTYTCSVCGEFITEEIPATGHTPNEGTVITERDYYESGEMLYTCTVCGEDYTEEIPMLVLPFTDVEKTESSSWYYDNVIWAYSGGIVKGTSDTEFSPDEGCTRAQIIIFLWRIAGEPDPSEDVTIKFTDVDLTEESSYGKALRWAVENDITDGITETTFEPDTVCTRAQIVTFIYRYLGYPQVDNAEDIFPDVPEGAYYEKAMLWAVENEITNGMELSSGPYIWQTGFNPDGTCTRAQAVTFLARSFAD